MKYIHNLGSATEPLTDADRALDRLFELTVLLGSFMERSLAERGLTRARATVLWRIFHEGPATQRVISQAIGVTPRNVTGLLDGLEDGGFIARNPHPTDRRATLVTITELGRATAEALHADHQRFAATLFAGFGGDELERFQAFLQLVLDRLYGSAAADAGQPA